MMVFKAQPGKQVLHKGQIIVFAGGSYQTSDKSEIETLGKAKGVTVEKPKRQRSE